MTSSTRVCRFFLHGNCPNGEDCNFSHSLATTELTRSNGMNSSPSTTKTTRTDPRKPSAFERNVAQGRGKLIASIDHKKYEGEESGCLIENCEFLASYNWKDIQQPTIYVPGCPPKWTPPPLPIQLTKDKGKFSVDHNGERSVAASFDPFFKALNTMQPGFDMQPIALVTDRNGLRKLLDFASGKGGNWRIDVDVVGNTMFFTRWEASRIRILTGSPNSGYGHSFEEAFTSFDDDLKDSMSHHRIVRYTLGGIECLLRYEADAYVEDASHEPLLSAGSASTLDSSDPSQVVESLASLSLNTLNSSSTRQESNKVQVIHRGRLVDHSSIAEIKCHKKVGLQKMMAQIWISQTTHLMVAQHKDGLIEDLSITDCADFTEWETKNKKELVGLVEVIKEIKDAALRARGGKCMVVRDKGEKPGRLKVYEGKRQGIQLPAGVKERCNGIMAGS